MKLQKAVDNIKITSRKGFSSVSLALLLLFSSGNKADAFGFNFVPSDLNTSYSHNKQWLNAKIQDIKQHPEKYENSIKSKFKGFFSYLKQEGNKTKPYFQKIKKFTINTYKSSLKPTIDNLIKDLTNYLNNKKNELSPETKQKINNLISELKKITEKGKNITKQSLENMHKSIDELISSFDKNNEKENNIIKTLKIVDKGIKILLSKLN